MIYGLENCNMTQKMSYLSNDNKVIDVQVHLKNVNNIPSWNVRNGKTGEYLMFRFFISSHIQ